VGHFVLYGLLSLFVILYSLSRPHADARRIVITQAGVLMALIGLEEWSQAWFPTRTFDWVDLLFGYAGVILFSSAAYWMKGRGSGSAAPAGSQGTNRR
jgi:VanZ family protein